MVEKRAIDFAGQAPEARVLQHQRRRYSIRLERVFWRFLEVAARNQKVRLSRLVADLAERHTGNNLASFLRSYAMLDAERRLAEQGFAEDTANLATTVAQCPAPGLVLGQDGTILAHNEALEQWLGPRETALVGLGFNEVFQVRTRRPLAQIWAEMETGALGPTQVHVLYIVPGHTRAAQARLVPVMPRNGAGFHCVVWLSSGARASLAGQPGAQTLAPATAAKPRSGEDQTPETT